VSDAGSRRGEGPGRWFPGQGARLAVAVLALAALTGGAKATPRDATVSAEALEARYGLRVTRVAVVGGGGLVDLRFRVMDGDKARALLLDHHSPRLLVLPGGPELVAPAHGARSVPIRDGASCFVLFPNTGNAVKPGSRVSVAFGAVLAEPVAAR
jgi:hypothetical protein